MTLFLSPDFPAANSACTFTLFECIRAQSEKPVEILLRSFDCAQGYGLASKTQGKRQTLLRPRGYAGQAGEDGGGLIGPPSFPGILWV